MTAATATHAFTASATDRTRCTCGKSRNTSVHGYDAKARKVSAARTGAETAAAKAQAVTAKQAAVTATAQAAEDAVAAVYARHATAVADAITSGVAVAARAEAAEEPRELSEQATATITDMRAAREAREAATATDAPAVKMTSLWVARNMVDGLIGLSTSADPAAVTLAGKVRDKTPNAEGGRTIRLTPDELAALQAHAVQVEAEASEEGGDRTVAMSARKLQGRLAKLMS